MHSGDHRPAVSGHGWSRGWVLRGRGSEPRPTVPSVGSGVAGIIGGVELGGGGTRHMWPPVLRGTGELAKGLGGLLGAPGAQP